MPFKVIKENILKVNDDIAVEIRAVLDENAVFMVNIISSPGSGKTTLLEKIAPALKEEGITFAVFTGDCFTSKDAERLDNVGINVIQINTGNSCHIDANLIASALKEVELNKLDFIIIENVGNIVCPAEFYLGEHSKIALLSVAEGHDKPLKYPLLFRESELVIINKTDLLEYTDFNLPECEKNISAINPHAKILKMSCRTKEGTGGFVEWIKGRVNKKDSSK